MKEANASRAVQRGDADHLIQKWRSPYRIERFLLDSLRELVGGDAARSTDVARIIAVNTEPLFFCVAS
jgi:hypothetical protein